MLSVVNSVDFIDFMRCDWNKINQTSYIFLFGLEKMRQGPGMENSAARWILIQNSAEKSMM